MTVVGPYPNDPANNASSIPVRVVGSSAGSSGGTVTPRAASNAKITTGGTAVVVITGPISGGYISNPTTAAGQGIGTAEDLYVDPVSVPPATDAAAAADGTTSIIVPGQSYTIPPLASGVTLRANAATSGHAFTAVVWS